MLPYDDDGKPLPRWRKIASLSCWSVNRWVSLVVGCIISAVAGKFRSIMSRFDNYQGTGYMFGVYGPFIMERMNYTASEINNVALGGNTGT